MNKQEYKQKIIEVLKEQGVNKITLVGSYARDEQHGDSDIDLIVEFDKDQRKSLMDFVRIEKQLNEAVGRKIDLLTKDSISPYILPFMEQDQVVIYEKR